ncbi:ATP-dependent RNA helicase RhlB [Cellvibrio sp. NN19]|uniref:ATP-dependent RNA helicase RhlB n=1 Tax=Cellvibrio chitinivorans TaxID=3102792 RepID=UPI002B4033FD|nr:ATP-dependent RNA helicase RhlB [Cellvibrio sp. NN19]
MNRLIGNFFKKLIGSGAAPAEKKDAHAKPASDKSSSSKNHSDRNSRNKSRNRNNSQGRNNSQDRSNAQGRGQRSGEHKDHSVENSRTENSRAEKAPKASKPAQDRAPKRPAKIDHGPWDISQFEVEPAEGKTRFHDLDLELPIMRAVADLGFKYCSPIQAQSLPHALQGKDVVGKAQTGTGKTAAFLTAIIDDLLKNPITEKRYAGEARALVIAPTRELVIQIAEDAKALCKYTDLKIHTLVGGMDYTKQQRRLHDDLVDILVATPGRLLDFCGNKDVYLDQLEVLVIDEADRMLDMGFIPQVRQIVRQTPKREDRQTLFFSATFTDDVRNLVEQWTYKPVTVEIEPESVANERVDQHVYLVSTEEKYTLLYNLIQQEHAESMIVFANRRDECRDLQEKLERHGIKAGLLSGEIAQNKRVATLDAFKSGELKVLVATDVAGRGIHISGISHVVNFTLPEEPEDYVHRIGRTGRAGKTGTSISFACEDDALLLEPIERLLGKPIKCEQPPEGLMLTPPESLPAPARARTQDRYNNRSVGNRSGGSRSRRPRN